MNTVGQYNKNAKCPYCGNGADGADGEGVPEEGCVAVCLRCANVSIYTKDLLLRRPTFKEHREIKVDDGVQENVKKVKSFLKSLK